MLFYRRRKDNINRIFKADNFTGISEDYHRLRLLENAVINYGGGRDELELRVRETARRIRYTDAESASVLDDVAAYLRDIAIAGKLNKDDFDEVHFPKNI
ncbi:hypothetical protein [Enterobacter quasiroggenkampii]|uniref:hypothetical protein n=1 Tax=Enterobacter quasiroggenkampii TaxID=2497436 RepID=UPI0021D1384C|nr:hypothetical protein [Enterobacter quasiroggenkampii]MCU6278386.1 hypothetical protein [Enterobacter quasiroggenkampii]